MQYGDLYRDRIMALCKKRKLSYNKLASLSGVGQSTIDNIIHGQTKDPKASTLHKIAQAFDMTLSQFLDYDALNDYYFEDADQDEGAE